MTLPRLPKTLPNRTAENLVGLEVLRLCTYISAIRLVAPITLVGLTALSEEINTNRSAPYLSAQSATLRVPKTLFLMASAGLRSIRGTCLCAAA
ncbi:hypothetical protein D3C73_1310530 [compost metagenome]